MAHLLCIHSFIHSFIPEQKHGANNIAEGKAINMGHNPFAESIDKTQQPLFAVLHT
jgi:hypothetical protein